MSCLLNDNETFWVSFITIVSGLIGIGVRYCFYSKCRNIRCCCISITRDIEAEIEEKEFEITHNLNRNQSEMKLSV